MQTGVIRTDRGAGSEIPLDRILDAGILPRVDPAQTANLTLQSSLFHKTRHGQLFDRAGGLVVLVRNRLIQREQTIRQNSIADADRGRQELGKRAEINHPAVLIQTGQRCKRFSGVAQFAVVVVFKDDRIAPFGPLHELNTLPVRDGCAVWERVRGRQIHHIGLRVFQLFQIDSRTASRHKNRFISMISKNTITLAEARIFKCDAHLRLVKHLAQNTEQALNTGAHNDVLRLCVDTASGGQILGNLLAQGIFPLCLAIAQKIILLTHRRARQAAPDGKVKRTGIQCLAGKIISDFRRLRRTGRWRQFGAGRPFGQTVDIISALRNTGDQSVGTKLLICGLHRSPADGVIPCHLADGRKTHAIGNPPGQDFLPHLQI